MKFIHAGDIHLDSALSGLSAHEDAPVDLLRTATRRAFEGLVERALAERVDFVALPGDLFDTGWRDYNTGLFFVRQAARLNQAGILVFLLRGNHDAEQDMTRNLTLPPNVRVFGAMRPETFEIDVDGQKVALHGQSFRTAATTDNLAAAYRPLPGCINIALLHTALGGGYAEHQPYAPCSLDELKNKGMDYWALGHVHEHAILSEAPWIAFSGNLQGRHIRERGPRGALLVTCEQGVILPPERIFVDVVRWERALVDLAGAATRADAMNRTRAAFETIMAGADGRRVACRVVLTGRTAAHSELFGQARALRADVVGQALTVGGDDLWIEKIGVETEPELDPAVIAGRADALADLQALLAEAADDADFNASLADDFRTLLAKMPADLFKQDLPALDAARAGDFAGLIASVAPGLIDRVAREG